MARGIGKLWQQIRSSLRWGITLLVTLALFASAPRVAQADALDDIASCLNAYSGYKSLAELGLSAADPEFLQCSSQIASGDVVLAATVVAIVGAGAAGAYGSKAECTNMTTGQIGTTISEILINTPGISDALKQALGDSYEKLVEFAAGEAGSNIAQIPGLDQIFQYMSCGCAVYGKAEAVAAIAKGYAKDVKQCAGFIANVGEAVLDGLESGAEAVGNLVDDIIPDADEGAFGSTEETPHVNVNTDYGCGDWIKFPRPYSFSKTADGATMISQTTATPSLTQTRTCTCYPPGRFERQEDPAGATDLIRCGCALPVGGTYDPKTRSCGCPVDQRIEEGACTPCEAERFSETAQTVTVYSGRLNNGICSPSIRTCPAGEKPVRFGVTDGYQCQPLCSADQFFVKAPAALAGAGSCGACPANFVPDAAALGQGALQCNECPAGTVAGPGDRQCRQLECPNGIDPANPHACRPACKLVGEGENKRLVCNGGDTVGNPIVLACPPRFIREGSRCVPEVLHKPKELIIERERKTVTPDLRKTREKNRKPDNDVVRERRRPQREEGDVLMGPVERQPSGPSVEEMLNFGLDVGRALELGRGQGRERQQPQQVPETAAEPRPDRRLAPATPPPPVPTYNYSKD